MVSNFCAIGGGGVKPMRLQAAVVPLCSFGKLSFPALRVDDRRVSWPSYWFHSDDRPRVRGDALLGDIERNLSAIDIWISEETDLS